METLTQLLPRPLPSSYSQTEIDEFARRVKNLSLFDRVEVRVIGEKLAVDVRHKKTLSPVFDFSTGKTLKDSSITLGAIEYDIDRHASRLHGDAKYSERGLNLKIGYEQHPYAMTRWAQEYELYLKGSGFRFEGIPSAWTRNRYGAVLEFVSPISYTTHLQWEVAFLPYYERLTGDSAPLTHEDGFNLGALFEVIWDRYHWDDVVPSGVKLVGEFRPGYFTDGSLRLEARFKGFGAIPLWPGAVLALHGRAAMVNTGNPNHSLLIGSQLGVRGLSDSLYRNAAHTFANLELRQAIELWPRLFLQPNLFVDAARFKPMDGNGNTTEWQSALSTGAGVRVLPTAMVNFLLRLDVAWLHSPEEDILVQLGIQQYF